jgi:hypothetical protein
LSVAPAFTSKANGEAGNGKGCNSHHPNAAVATPTAMRAMAAKVAKERDVRDTRGAQSMQETGGATTPDRRIIIAG